MGKPPPLFFFNSNLCFSSQNGETWKGKNCSVGICDNGSVTYKHIQCPTLEPLVCANTFPAIEVKDDHECCSHYECQCKSVLLHFVPSSQHFQVQHMVDFELVTKLFDFTYTIL